MSELKHCFDEERKRSLIADAATPQENYQAMLTNTERARRIRDAMDNHEPPIRGTYIAATLGIKPQAVTGWRKTGRIAKDHLNRFARIVGKPVTWFMDNDQSAEQPLAAYLTDEEQQLLHAYRQSSQQWRLSVRLLASLPIDNQEKAAEAINALLARLAAR